MVTSSDHMYGCIARPRKTFYFIFALVVHVDVTTLQVTSNGTQGQYLLLATYDLPDMLSVNGRQLNSHSISYIIQFDAYSRIIMVPVSVSWIIMRT